MSILIQWKKVLYYANLNEMSSELFNNFGIINFLVNIINLHLKNLGTKSEMNQMIYKN